MPPFTSSTFGHYSKKWLIVTGVFELLLAAGFVFGAVQVPTAAFGFYLTAVILGITGLVLVTAGWRVGASADEATGSRQPVSRERRPSPA